MLISETIDRQLLSQPKETIFCTRCVVSNQRPRITFNKDGVCSACQYAEMKHTVIDWKAREEQLVDVLDKYRSKNGSYDCIVPGSGGKDSAFVAHILKHRYGMHPLTITFAPFVYTDIGWKNYVDFKDSGFDNYLFFPDGRIHRKLARLCFELLGDAWQPFAYGQKAYAFNMAVRFGIPLMFYGESGEVEYGGSMKNMNKPFEDITDWDELYFKGAGVDKVVEIGLKHGILTEEEVKGTTFDAYRPPPLEKVRQLDAQMHWFSYYQKWVPQENYYYAVEHTAFTANPMRSEGTYSKYASLDDRTDGFHFYLAYMKFGIGRATSDAAHEVRDGHLTRDEAVALVRRYDGEFPKKYYQEFLEYIGLTDSEFWQVIDKYRSPQVWRQIDGEWKIRHTVWGGGCDDSPDFNMSGTS